MAKPFKTECRMTDPVNLARGEEYETTPLPQFAVGDIVRLKSGGPFMTFGGPSPEDSRLVTCVWFDKSAEMHEEAFREEWLRAADPAVESN